MYRKRQYRKRIKCTACSKVIYSDYKLDHLKRKHGNNLSVKFISFEEDLLQKKLSFLPTAATSTAVASSSDNATGSSSSSLAVHFVTNVEDIITLDESVSVNQNVLGLTAEEVERFDIDPIENASEMEDQDNEPHETLEDDKKKNCGRLCNKLSRKCLSFF